MAVILQTAHLNLFKSEKINEIWSLVIPLCTWVSVSYIVKRPVHLGKTGSYEMKHIVNIQIKLNFQIKQK